MSSQASLRIFHFVIALALLFRVPHSSVLLA